MTIAQRLGDPGELTRFTVHYYECFLRTKRLRDIPEKQLAVRNTISNHDLVKKLMRETTPASKPDR